MRCVRWQKRKKERKNKFSGPGENCQRNVTDLEGSPVTSSRPSGRLQKRPDNRTWNAGVAVRTADGSRRTADAADEQYLRCGCNSPSCTVVVCAADIDGPMHAACTAPAEERPASAARRCDYSIITSAAIVITDIPKHDTSFVVLVCLFPVANGALFVRKC